MKKALIALTLCTALAAPVTTFALYGDETAGGEVDVNSDYASSKTEIAGGGTWKHGFSGFDVYSHYNHTSKTHRATVKNFSVTERDTWRSSSYGYSKAELPSTLIGNKAYWATK
ncbi:lactococcin 972 family bacteriocin [Neobacillus sp. KR4-4]|uniref:lactococcin 972 family bacteriocin n=1 Tax=Neobacillus sp. KR4-4 TaxID=3344872 RepID=UPI0035CB142C